MSSSNHLTSLTHEPYILLSAESCHVALVAGAMHAGAVLGTYQPPSSISGEEMVFLLHNKGLKMEPNHVP